VISKNGQVIVSIVVTIGFVILLFLWILRPVSIAAGAASEVLNVLVGSLAAAFGQVVSYWLGSSVGSRDKDETLKELAKDKTV